jgi:uncharacterized protein YndB with AHSA1/START domain
VKFETTVRIARSVEEVFTFISDPDNFPQWNSAVQAVRKTSQAGPGVGATYVMERELPSGRARNELEVMTCERPIEFSIRTTSGPTPFVYRYRLASENGVTVVHLDAEVELEGAAAMLGPLARRAVKKGVDDNFATLKQILEATHP